MPEPVPPGTGSPLQTYEAATSLASLGHNALGGTDPPRVAACRFLPEVPSRHPEYGNKCAANDVDQTPGYQLRFCRAAPQIA